MEKVVMFKAIDGKLFETEEDCIYHEKYLNYRTTIYTIFDKYTPPCKYPNILTDIPEFRQEVAEALGFRIEELIILNELHYYFVPNEDDEDGKEKIQAWEDFDYAHILPW